MIRGKIIQNSWGASLEVSVCNSSFLKSREKIAYLIFHFFSTGANEMFQSEVSNFYSAVTSMEQKEKDVLMQMENSLGQLLWLGGQCYD